MTRALTFLLPVISAFLFGSLCANWMSPTQFGTGEALVVPLAFPAFRIAAVAFLTLWFITGAILSILYEEKLISSLEASSSIYSPFLLTGLHIFQECCFLNDIHGTQIFFAILFSVLKFINHTKGKTPKIQAVKFNPFRKKTGGARWSLIVFMIGLLPAFAQIFGIFGEVREPVGDEPSYMIIAHSLAYDHDLLVAKEYRNKVYRKFHSAEYPIFAHPGKNRELYPHHSPGLPLLMVPFYLIGDTGSGEFLNDSIRLCLGIIYALLAVQFFKLAVLLSGDKKIALAAVFLVFFTIPLLFYADEIYPETLAALTAVISIRYFMTWNESTKKQRILCGMLIFYLPWLGVKYFGIMGALLLLFLVLSIRNRSKKELVENLFFIMPGIVSLTLYFTMLYVIYGKFSPSIIYYGAVYPPPERSIMETLTQMLHEAPIRLAIIIRFAAGVLLEQRMGLLIYAPVWLTALWGICTALKTNFRKTLFILLPFLVHVSLYAYHNNWGGYAPVNRPLISGLPLLGIGFIYFLKRLNRTKAYLWLILSCLSILIAFLHLTNIRWIYHTLNPNLTGGAAQFLDAASFPFSPYLPHYFPLIMGEGRQALPNIIWSCGLLLLLILFFIKSAKNPARQKSEGLNAINAATIRNVALAFFLLLMVWNHWALPLKRAVISFQDAGFEIIKMEHGIYDKEPEGFWTGKGTHDFYIQSKNPIESVEWQTHSLVQNRIAASCGTDSRKMELLPQVRKKMSFTPQHTFVRKGLHYCRCRIWAENELQPSADWNTTDDRFLAVFLKIRIREK